MSNNIDGVDIQWLGHSTFLITTALGKQILVDPWLAGNPACDKQYHDCAPDLILVTHGHADHIGDLVATQKRGSSMVAAIYEITHWLETRHAVPGNKLQPMNKGGTIDLTADFGLRLTMVDARHSAGFTDEDRQIVYLGEAAGFIADFVNGPTVYIAGDTCVFADMQTVAALYQPDIAILPIGDRFTMGPKEAALAVEWLKVKQVIPCHYGTFPALTGNVDAFHAALGARSLLDCCKIVTLPR